MNRTESFLPYKNISFLRLFPFFLLIFLNLTANAQYFNGGQDPGSFRWKSINTIHFEVIFPEHFEEKAHEVAQVLEKAYRYANFSLNHRPKRVSVVLHTGTLTSNAFLGWAPSRMEMYTTPPQRSYSQDWLHQLAIHEYRHMVQLSKIEEEMPQILRVILGEHASALIVGAYLPFWFLEGDAVAIETALSTAGRGRMASFFMDTKAQLLDKGRFSYDKAYHGSYKDHVPNYYRMGYLMVGGSRALRGEQFWDRVVHHVAKHPFGIVSFNKSIKANFGLTKSRMYDSIYSYLESKWRIEDQQKNLTDYTLHSSSPKKFTSYLYPGKTVDNSFVALKESKHNIPGIVKIDVGGKEEVLHSPGYIFPESMKVGRSKVVWCERMPDIRWSYNDHTRLCVLDIKTGKVKYFRFKEKLFAPAISPNERKIVMVESQNDYRFNLVFFDLEKESITHKISSFNNHFLVTPSWDTDNEHLLLVEKNANKKRIVRYSYDKRNEPEIILPWTNTNIIHPVRWKDYVLFSADYSGTDNVYAVKDNEHELYKVVNARFGIGSIFIDDNELIYNDYSADGFRIVSNKLDQNEFKLIENNEDKSFVFGWADSLTNQEKGVVDFSDLPNITYTPGRYSKLAHGLNIHSWAPAHIDVDNQSLDPGITFASQNKLSTLEMVGGYKYLLDQQAGQFFGNFKYMGWFPVLEGGFTTGKTSQTYNILHVDKDNNPTDTTEFVHNGNNSRFTLTASVPIRLSRGKYYRTLMPITQLIHSQSVYESNQYKLPTDINYTLAGGGIYYHSLLRTSDQDIFPDWGIVTNVFYLQTINGNYNLGKKFSVDGQAYLPGILVNHGFKVYAGYQQSIGGVSYYSDLIKTARGFKKYGNDDLLTVKLDYAFPICHPDWNISSLFYIKRLKTQLFFDYSHVGGYILDGENPVRFEFPLKSTGLELTTDAHILRFLLPFEIGLRSTYILNADELGVSPFRFDFLFSMDINI